MFQKLKGVLGGGSSSSGGSGGAKPSTVSRAAPRQGVDYDAINKTLDRALFTPQYDACGSILVRCPCLILSQARTYPLTGCHWAFFLFF
jgi:hypothetical protein